MQYRAAPGHNNVAGLTVITPTPYCPGTYYARRTYAADGSVHEDGALLSTFRYSALSADEYTSLLTFFGLTASASAEITVETVAPGGRELTQYNATIIRPADPVYRNGVYHDADFALVGLEEI